MTEKKKPRGRMKSTSRSKPKTPKARSPEAREKQLINMAMDLAQTQMEEGTATAQVITHFLKLGTEAEKLAREKLEAENNLLKARVEALASQQKVEELYAEALSAMRKYSGSEEDDPFKDEFDDD